MQTQSEQSPPTIPPKIAIGFEGDDIESIAEQVMAMEPEQKRALLALLNERLGIQSKERP